MLVDLCDRCAEPAVRSLVRAATASRASAERALERYAVREWLLAGWQEDGEIVACAGLERVDADTIELHSLAVESDHRGRGVGRALVEAVADVATAARLVVETDGDSVGFYERCGFAVAPAVARGEHPRFRCVRELVTNAAPSGEPAATLSELEDAIRMAWSRETSDDPDEWRPENPARGQCGVTSLFVRDVLGGDILVAHVLRDGNRVERHAWNRLESGISLDLTRCQFRHGEELGEPRTGEPLVGARNRERYELFASRVRERLSRSELRRRP